MATAPAALDAYREEADRFIAALDEEYYLHFAGLKEEFELAGLNFHDRGKRMDEMIEVMRLLWTGEMVEHHGRFFDFPPMQMSPPPTQRVPIVIGGQSDAALRRAARNANRIRIVWLRKGSLH